ncbi:MAG: sortase [Bacilli bacterium]|nr:sortase [Bacilli bacterium]
MEIHFINILTILLKKSFLFLIILSCILVSLTLIRIDKKEVFKNEITMQNKSSIRRSIKEEQPIGIIQIPKIDLEKSLYDRNSKKNNIEENVTILKESKYPEEENSILFIAAHSGTGEIAFFQRLDELQEQDEVHILLFDKVYTYQVKSIYEQQKDGYIRGYREEKRQLVLTTCCPQKENCQLIINCIEKESS